MSNDTLKNAAKPEETLKDPLTELLASIREAGKILKEEQDASRQFIFNSLDVKKNKKKNRFITKRFFYVCTCQFKDSTKPGARKEIFNWSRCSSFNNYQE